MKRTLFGGAAAIVALCAMPVLAQTAPQPTAFLAPAAVPMAGAPTAGSNAMLRVGTELPLRLLEELTTQGKRLRVGNRFRMETSEALTVQGNVVIPAGSPAVGEITDVRNKGMWGKSGRLTARLLYVTVGGRQIRLSGGFDDKGVAGGIGAVAVSAIVFAPAGFFMTGTSARVPSGTVVKGFIDEDVPLALPAPAPVVMTIEPEAVALPTETVAMSAPAETAAQPTS